MIAFITFALLAVAWGKPAALSRNPMINEGLFEGDIMGIDPNADRNAVPNDNQRWPNGVVYYTIDPSLNRITNMIHTAMKEIQDKTCIRFVQRTNQKDYIRLFYGEGCWSYLGCIYTGQQDLSLGSGCDYHGTVVHELLHALGFDHEHNRSDRDDHVNIIWANIAQGWDYAFKKLEPHENRLFQKPFDFDSIMLYGEEAFTKQSGLKTMVPVGPYRYMPEPYDKKGLSNLDVTKVKALYQC